MTWFDEKDGNREVYLHASPGHNLHGTIDANAVRVTTTAGASIGAYLAANENRIGLARSDNTDGQYEVYFQEFGFDAQARSTARRLSSTPVQSLIPAIEAYGADFIIAWNEVNRPITGYHSMETRSEVVFRKILP